MHVGCVVCCMLFMLRVCVMSVCLRMFVDVVDVDGVVCVRVCVVQRAMYYM